MVHKFYIVSLQIIINYLIAKSICIIVSWIIFTCELSVHFICSSSFWLLICHFVPLNCANFKPALRFAYIGRFHLRPQVIKIRIEDDGLFALLACAAALRWRIGRSQRVSTSCRQWGSTALLRPGGGRSVYRVARIYNRGIVVCIVICICKGKKH